MKPLIIIIAVVLLGGCSMTNEEVIAECKKCEDAGMEAALVYNMWTYSTVRVDCHPKEAK